MTEEELEEGLRRWGRVYGEAAPQEWGEERVDEAHVGGFAGGFRCALAGAGMMARGGAARVTDVAWRRSRAALARAPFSDPVRATETRTHKGALHFSGAEVGRVEPLAARIERAVVDLYRINTLRGLVLRAQYCKRGRQAEKVEWINGQGRGIQTNLRAYRDELAHARTWLHGRLS